MRNKRILLGALALCMLFASVALANGSPIINWWVIGGGGGSAMAGNTSLDSTIGQWVVGSDESGSRQLDHGFWGGGRDRGQAIYLPVLLRGFP